MCLPEGSPGRGSRIIYLTYQYVHFLPLITTLARMSSIAFASGSLSLRTRHDEESFPPSGILHAGTSPIPPLYFAFQLTICRPPPHSPFPTEVHSLPHIRDPRKSPL